MRNCDAPDPNQRVLFEQPVLQTAQMFIGEMGCWIVLLAQMLFSRLFSRIAPSRGRYAPVNTTAETDRVNTDSPENSPPSSPTGFKPPLPSRDSRLPLTGARVLLLAIPACCDIAGTTLMNVGLLFVAASIYQMTRGALVLFVGLFSVLFLRRRLVLYQWISLIVVVVGVAIVGLAGVISSTPDSIAAPKPNTFKQTPISLNMYPADGGAALRTIIGVLLIAAAQIFTATQFVLEEWILEHYALEPLKVVGWEGIFGFGVTVLGMIILHLLVGRTKRGRHGYFDAVEGWKELSENRAIAVSSLLIMVSIGYVCHLPSCSLRCR